MKFGMEVYHKRSYIICESYHFCCLCCELHSASDKCTVGVYVKLYYFF
jgi:hypothetical protein